MFGSSARARGAFLAGASTAVLAVTIASPGYAQNYYAGTGAGTASSGNYDTGVGTNSSVSVTGSYDSSFGYNSGMSVLGDENIGIGLLAGSTVSGMANSAVGNQAGISISGFNNSAFGNVFWFDCSRQRQRQSWGVGRPLHHWEAVISLPEWRRATRSSGCPTSV